VNIIPLDSLGRLRFTIGASEVVMSNDFLSDMALGLNPEVLTVKVWEDAKEYLRFTKEMDGCVRQIAIG
jgi:hypothetical protein